jgi:hypothetical protein
MSLATQGFLSPEVEKFRLAVRSTARFKIWFDFADELIRSGFAILKGHETEREPQQLLMSGLFVRAHQSLQAALILAERGMVPDARGVVRSAVETAIASVALGEDRAFIDQIIGADSKHKLTLARAILGDANYKALHSPDQVKILEETVRNIEAIDKKSPRAPTTINWKSVADKYCKDLYTTLYRLLSSDGTHTTADLMNRYFEADKNGLITALKLGPDPADLDETLNAACLTFLWTAFPFARLFKYREFEQELDGNLKKYRELSDLPTSTVPTPPRPPDGPPVTASSP